MKIKTVKAPKWFINLQYILLPLMLSYFVFVNPKYLFMVDLTKSEDLLGLLLIVLLFSFHTHYHETSHWIAAKACRIKAKVSISRKLCVIKGEIKPGRFFIIALSPFLLDLTIIYLLFEWNQNLLFFIGLLLITAIGGFLGDLWMALSAFPYFRKKDFYFKYKRSGEFYLCKNQQHNMLKTTNVI